MGRNDDDDDSDVSLRPVTPERGHSESSVERSVYASADALATGVAKEYGFYRTKTKLGKNLQVCEGLSKNDVYFAEMAMFANRPEVNLHEGSYNNGPVVGSVSFRLSKHLTLRLGPDPHSEAAVEMKNESGLFRHSKYSMPTPGGRKFVWERIRSGKGELSTLNKLSRWNYKLVEEDTGEVMAVYLSNTVKSWLKSGKLQIKSQLTADEELYALLGALGLCEKVRRRSGGGGVGVAIGAGAI